LGPSDAVGWIGNKKAIITGLTAFTAKEVIEAQYDLLLKGINTYIL
jgi:NADH dehydrogenase